jgi:phospholipid-binding lipoprotein MlaA
VLPLCAAGAIALLTVGCASTPKVEREPGDPVENLNRSVYNFNDDLDVAVLQPVAGAYVSGLPQPVRTGVSNFYDNIQYLDTTLNGFLQGKVLQGTSDLGRFVVNSTVGILGIFDVATPIGLVRHDEDFGQTLATWNAGDGAFLMYPLIGPSSVRDTGGIIVSALTNPIMYASAPVAIPLGLLGIVDLRARSEGFVRFRDQAALDPYIFTRESYLQNRQFMIYDGNPPRPAFLDEPDVDVPAADTSAPPATAIPPADKPN